MSVGVLFPGQGSQFVGMGSDLFDALPDLLGDRSDDILGWSLREICLDGPEETLIRTEYAQPALFALSYALWTKVAEALPTPPGGAAGHSLGEYTALVASGAMSYDEGLAVVAGRGLAMAAAADAADSGMAALMGADEAMAVSVAEQNAASGGSLQVANLNGPGQVVVAGSADDIVWLREKGRDLGVRRVIPLSVAGAFHSSYMASSQPTLAQALEKADIGAPAFPVWSNTTAAPHEPSNIAGLLVSQVVSPVLFGDSLVAMSAAGISTFIHVGPGDVTAGMARRSVEDADVLTVSSLNDIGAVASLGTIA